MEETQELGIKEAKEALIGVNELALALLEVAKDGLQPVQDGAALFAKYQSDEAFRTKLDAAVAGISGAVAELKSPSIVEVTELIGVQISYVPKLIEAMKP